MLFDDYIHNLQAPHSIPGTILLFQPSLIDHLECKELNFFKALFNKLVTVLLVDDNLPVGMGYLQLEVYLLP